MTTEFIPESIGELARFFVAFREEIRGDLSDIKETLKGTVSRDVYHLEKDALKAQWDAEHTALMLRVSTLEDERRVVRQRANQAVMLGLTGLVFPLIVLAISWVVLGQHTG